MKLFRIRGGIHPHDNKHLTADKPITPLPLFYLYHIPLQQHIGSAAEPEVEIGDRVLKGQLIASARGMISANIHAPTSGIISAIGPYVAPHASGLMGRTITIEADRKDEWCELPSPLDWENAEPSSISKRVAECGIVGMGGATFPAAVKLNLGSRYALKTLVMNGAECEPYLTCDDRLMQEKANEVMLGVAIMCRSLGVDEAIIAIEKNKPEAIEAMKNAAKAYDKITVVALPTRYPMGSEKHLVQTLTGKETPARGLTADIGVVVHNVATAHAVHNAVLKGIPLIERIVTITGRAVRTPRNLNVLIGTPISELIDFCGGFEETPQQILCGGPMMGQPLRTTAIPIVKGMNGVLGLNQEDMKQNNTMPCIRCASCVSACPCGLVPLQMAAHIRADDLEGAIKLGLQDCISCGSCSFVCPSHIPLVQSFNFAKGKLTETQRTKHRQEETKRLAEARTERMEREAVAKREAMMRKKAAMAANRKQATS
jgi:Na+-translocating ferredoxin:NAD+ oxidoreductase subunit C